MKTVLLCIGKTKDSLMSEGITLYTKRVQRYMPFDVVALPDVKCYNPAFEVTDNSLMSAIITVKGICRPPFSESLKKLFEDQPL